jgi:hypothetical protein
MVEQETAMTTPKRESTTPGGYAEFRAWEALVDAHVSKLAGVGLFDLPDVPTRDWYEDGVSAVNAARRAIRMAKEY